MTEESPTQNAPTREGDLTDHPGESRTNQLYASFMRLPPRLQISLMGVAAFALVVLVWFVTRVQTAGEHRAPASVASPPSVSPDSPESDALALARSRTDRAWGLAEGAQLAFRTLRDAAKQRGEFEALLTNNDGRLLASNPQAVEAFDAILRKPRASAVEIDGYDRALKALAEPLEDARKSPASLYSPSDQVLHELERLRELVRKSGQELQDQLDMISAMLATARRQNQLSPLTLADAIERLREKRANESADYLSERERVRQRESDKALADAEDERQRRLTEAMNQARDSEVTQKELEVKARRDDIKKKYKPFLELGKFKPLRNANPVRTDTALPMSYADLKAFGVFNDYKTFALAGGGIWGGHNRSQNDRPTWPCPRRDEDFDQYKELFREFCELAPIWAKDGTLAP